MNYALLYRFGVFKMLQGRVVIDFQYDEEKEQCSWDIKQKGKDMLSKDDLIQLLQHCIGELMTT
ncbi:MAG: hypothetical protein BV459_07230 [Thermoplasmata archaeon M11B2D]|nr:MAG: hypothetical protein BV459_07230 [Thermoplasmata archaeon M11B2D]PNX50940.1 MAG: hypothetical protein BV458_12305 [Thermoplasmata archaeon M9B2D]